MRSSSIYFSEPYYNQFRLNDRTLVVSLTDAMMQHGELRGIWPLIPYGAVNVCVEYTNLRSVFESNHLLNDHSRMLTNRGAVWAQIVDFGPERVTHRNGSEVISEFHIQDRHENVRVHIILMPCLSLECQPDSLVLVLVPPLFPCDDVV